MSLVTATVWVGLITGYMLQSVPSTPTTQAGLVIGIVFTTYTPDLHITTASKLMKSVMCVRYSLL